MKRRNLIQIVSALPAFAAMPVVFAHGNEDHSKHKLVAVKREQKDWGVAGQAKAVKRSIKISMTDNMRFAPDKLQVKLGETIRFRVRNDGKMMHEFVIGTKAENAKHAELMIKFPQMEHDEPYMAHVPSGKTGEIVWQFNRKGTFEFACLIAGHYQAGMIGNITVT